MGIFAMVLVSPLVGYVLGIALHVWHNRNRDWRKPFRPYVARMRFLHH